MKAIRIAQITDLHLDEAFQIENGVETRSNFLTALNDSIMKKVDRIVCTGDIGNGLSYPWFFEQMQNCGIPFKVLLGNHDTFNEVSGYYDVKGKSNPAELYYADEDKEYKYLYLDTSSCKVSHEQLKWIEQELKTSKKVIVFSHHPILNTGTTPQQEYPLEGDQVVEQLLNARGQQVKVFCGHLHMDHRMVLNNIEQFVSPATCLQVKKHSDTTEIASKDFGYRIIELSENGVNESVYMFEPN